ncbi:MAG: ATP-dependent helicase/nuclease subunit B [Arenicella sp.]|jgi:ATP-dependent helicase/nuclease subunit B
MESFLEKQISLIFDQNNDGISDISIIIPNKRAAVYLQKYISKRKKAAFFSPEILTINEWIDENTPQRVVGKTELLFALYNIHQKIEGDNQETFESFSQWGTILLSDFDEIDRYLIEPQSIFKNLQSIKEIENWSFGEGELSSGQEKFKTLWDKLIDYYHLLNEHLIEKNEIYAGKAYANFLKNINQIETKSHYYFLGFNAISRSEQEIMAWFRKEKKATVAFDIDQFYFDNPDHEARYFYDRICKEWNLKPQVGTEFNDIPKTIEVIETSQQISQVKICGEIVRKLKQDGEHLNDIAIILADESLLIPLTNSLPAEIEQANITMGYPIKFSHLKGLVDLIFELQFNFKKFGSGRLYHKSIIEFIQHAYVKLIVKNSNDLVNFQQSVLERNIIFMELDELIAEIPELENLKLLLEPWGESATERIAGFKHLTKTLYASLKSEANKDIDLEIVYHFSKAIERYEEVWSTYQIDFNLRTFKLLFYQFWQGESLSFLGNPTEGLQVMGILETRTLDFKNLIILGMNEGSLPKSNVVNSMIPRDLRLYEKQLPTEEDRQAIFAHHFYRLLQRSTNIFMTYNSHGEGLGGGEPSRFITQIEHEINPKFGHEFKRKTYSTEDKNATTTDASFLSTPRIQERIDKLFARGLSPSAFNKLIQCPLDFYYRYVIGLSEEGEVEENIESSTFGTKIHDVLEAIIRDNFFVDGKGSALTITALKAEKKKIHQRLKEAYLNGENGKSFSESDLKFGQNKLSFEVSEELIRKFIESQIKEVTENSDAIIPVGLELKDNFYADIEFEINGETKPLKIKGTADRIDKVGGLYRIIDYKSGKCDDTKVKFNSQSKKVPEEMPHLIVHKDKAYARQLLMYALMFNQQFPEHKIFTAGIVSMINISDWVQNVRPSKKGAEETIDEDLLNDFKDALISKITELYDSDYEFVHNPKSDYCQHCGK